VPMTDTVRECEAACLSASARSSTEEGVNRDMIFIFGW
jgi:hypothetical protein